MDIQNEGHRLLCEALAKHGAAEQLAEDCGVKPATVSRWRHGVKPDGDNRVVLQRVLKIPFESWADLPTTDQVTTLESGHGEPGDAA